MRALFVDDELEFLELMQKRLLRRGMEVATAPDGQTALNMVDEALSLSPLPNIPNCAGSRAGSARPRWRKACEVNSRPRGVRCR